MSADAAARARDSSERVEAIEVRDLYAAHEKIFTRSMRGRFQRLRLVTGWPLLVGYFGVPWLTWDGREAMLFDLPSRQFHVLGTTFWPQDFWLLGFLLIVAAFGLFTVTTFVGRLWCGYTCPQTVWTAIFMWIEEQTEGPRHQRIRLEAAPWSMPKLAKRSAKHALWLGVAAVTGITFVGYFTPIRDLVVDLATGSELGWAAFWVASFTMATYVNAGWLREQVCTFMCPYARFQSAMFDRDSLIVSYDGTRGEPRGSRSRTAREEGGATELGDCIDCKLCVQVCPTGIDIRDGLQYECIGCAHCVDACDSVMDKVGYARGLIRYTTERALGGEKTHWVRPRAVGYAALLVVMSASLVYALASRVPFELNVQRPRGELYAVTNVHVTNAYRLTIANKSQTARSFEISLEDTNVQIAGSASWSAQPGEVLDVPMVLQRDALVSAPVEKVTLRMCDAASGECVWETTTFIGATP